MEEVERPQTIPPWPHAEFPLLLPLLLRKSILGARRRKAKRAPGCVESRVTMKKVPFAAAAASGVVAFGDRDRVCCWCYRVLLAFGGCVCCWFGFFFFPFSQVARTHKKRKRRVRETKKAPGGKWYHYINSENRRKSVSFFRHLSPRAFGGRGPWWLRSNCCSNNSSSNSSAMSLRLRSCCLCLSPRTGSAVLGCLGVAAFVAVMVPEVLLLQDHQT